jgi:cytoskeletal protein CcmA (bactofilin family)
MEAGVSNTKLRVEQIKSEDGFTSLSVDLEALRGQVKDIIGSADYKEEITGEYAKVQIVDLAAHLDASGASSLSVKQAANVVGAFSVNTDKFTIAAASGNTMVNGTFNAKGAADLDSTLNVDGAAVMKSTLSVTGSADFLAAVVARSTFNAVGAADLDSTLNVDGASDLHGAVKAYGTLEVDGESTLASAIIEDITAQHIMFAGAAHEVSGSASLKWDGTDLIVGSAKVSDLTDARVTFAGADGALMDDAKMTFAAGVLTVSGSTYSANASIAGNLTVNGNFVVEGDTVTQNVTTVTTEDSVITLNKNASSVPAAGAGIEFEVSGTVAGYVKTNASGDMLIKAATGSELTLDVNAASTIAVAGNLTVESGPSYINQDVTTDAMPEFTKAKLWHIQNQRDLAAAEDGRAADAAHRAE